MTHQWHRGTLNASSWHGLEEVGVMADADAMIDAGERTGAWPVSLREEDVYTATALKVAGKRAIVADYRNHPTACLSVVGGRYRATTTDEWRELCRAAVVAGAKPTGAFSLRDGTRVLATFEVGLSNGLRTNLVIADAFDGSMSLRVGFTTVRVVCANTLSAAMSQDGAAMAGLRHTASLEEKVAALTETIGVAIESGQSIRETFEATERARLPRAAADRAFDLLFPPAADDATPRAKTMADNARNDARVAASNPVNNCGDTVATLWNAATYLVDRNADGSTRETRGADRLDALLFGGRQSRITEIQTIIEVIMRDGSIQHMTAPQAVEAGVDPRLAGRAILDGMLADLN